MRCRKMQIITATAKIAKQTKTKTKTKTTKATAITTAITITIIPIRMRTATTTPITTIDRRMRPLAEEPARAEEPAQAEAAVWIRTLKPEDEDELEVVVDTVETVL